MPRTWENLAQSTDGDYVVDDFRQAFYQLVSQQCLYARFVHQGVAFRLISRYRAEFKEAADLLGLQLAFNDRLEYCYVNQAVARHSPMDLHETMFLLVLRHAYHLHASAGDLTPDGDAVISIPELQETYKGLTGRDLDTRTQALRAQVKAAQRSGLARQIDADDGDGQPFAIAVLPGVADVLSEHAVNRFGAHLKASLIDVPPSAATTLKAEEEQAP
jgi:Domain of unknown function (DUF4194)